MSFEKEMQESGRENHERKLREIEREIEKKNRKE